MAIEFIGSLVNAALRSPSSTSGGPASALATDPGYPARMAVLHERSGFDRLLVGHSSSSPDGFTVANQVLKATSRLAVLLAEPITGGLAVQARCRTQAQARPHCAVPSAHPG
jgi:alkanesulfonate monooxygenase